ncbi:MAG: STAS domain-containing protein [Roseiflexaceae bacterium]
MSDHHPPAHTNGSAPSAPAEVAQLQALAQFQQAILDTLPTRVGVYEIVDQTDFRLVVLNQAAIQADQGTPLDLLGRCIDEFLPPATAAQMRHQFQACVEHGAAQTVESSYQLPEGSMWVISTCAPIRDADGHITHILNTWEDITARKLRDLEERRYQEAVIEQQAATLAELSTPLLAISATTVIMPLIGAVDSVRAHKMTEALLMGIAGTQARVAILDITGVPIVDTQVANAFIQAAQAVQLLGATVVLTGIRPEVAQTLVGMGVELRGIITRGTLRDGIAYALQNGISER